MSSYNQDIGSLTTFAVYVWCLQFVDFLDESIKTLLHCFS
jgi:hypothetical protein